jgi:hypothetical protein
MAFVVKICLLYIMLIVGGGKKGVPQRGESKSQASKAIRDFDTLSTREQREALQHFGRVVKKYEDAQRFLRRADRTYNEIMEELNRNDSTEFYRSMRSRIEELERDRKKAYGVMRQLKDEYKKAKKYLDTEMTSLMPPIEEADEPDPRAAAEEGSGVGGAMAGRGAKFSIAREAKVLPEPRVTILEQSESFDESIPDEDIPETFEIPEAYTRPPVLAIEGKNDEDASYYSIVGEDEESFHTAEGSGISFSRQARVAPTGDTQRQTAPDDDRRATAEDAQDEMIGIPATFDDTESTTGSVSSFDSYEDYLRRQGIYFLGR